MEFLSKHIDRLFRSAEAIKLSLPFTNDQLRIQLKQLIEINKLTTDGKINLQVTRGSAKRNHILHGYVRDRIKTFIDALDMKLSEIAFGIDDLPNADEVFLTSSTAEVMPVVEVDQIEIGNGKPGVITQALQEAYQLDAGLNSFSN